MRSTRLSSSQVSEAKLKMRDPEARRFYLVRTKYFIYYRAKGAWLEIIAFWHSSREARGASVRV